jgi:predicted transcriptional regulator YheO
MLRQINIIEALKRYMKDDEAKILVPKNGYDADDWENLEAMYLGQYLENVIFLADGPPKHVREETVKANEEDIVFPDEHPIDTDDTEPDVAPDGLPAEYVEDPFEEEEFDPDMEELDDAEELREAEQKPKKEPGPKKIIDDGKILALYKTGTWTVKDIADDMGLGQATVYKHLKKMGGDLKKIGDDLKK